MATISAVIITRNEAEHIAACLDSLGCVDEIIVFDAESTDGTREIASRYTPHVYCHAWTGFSMQKNLANECASGEWILSIDADERVTPELAAEIRRAVRESNHVAYHVPTRFVTFGRPLRYGGWYPQHHIRLFRRGRAYWGRDVHETLAVDGQIGFLVNPLMHYAHPTVTRFIEKLNRYTTIEAEVCKKNGKEPSVLRMLFVPLARFGYKYIWQRGFMDGTHGLVVATLLAVDSFVTEAKLWQAREGDEGVD